MKKVIDFTSIKDIDYEKVGLISGLEIHQQLDTGKLFSNAPCKIVPNEELDGEVTRKIRFSKSESGDIDAAALNEFKKDKKFVYRYNDEIATLVDLDEEPPVGPNQVALNMAVRVSEMFNLTFFDSLYFMRKLIIDGSVTGGFQRTAILGFDGYFDTSFGRVKIEGINLEEDSCRVISREDERTIFSLDRQGIPLVEITTGPDMKTPDQILEGAQFIGNVLRSFSETRRGLGTIRQDLNISIARGKRVEIKGAQNLKLIPQIVESEVKRQMVLVSICDELEERGVTQENFCDGEVYDVGDIFSNTESKVVLSNLNGKNTGVLGIKLKNFKGILGTNIQENFRFATEVSDRNKQHFTKVKGLFHSDELPKYGIEEEDVVQVRKAMNCEEDDSFIILAGEKDYIKDSLLNIVGIIEHLMAGVPTEVRQIIDSKEVNTKFLRPMPGAARMYPETDIEILELKDEYLNEMRENIPEMYDKKIERLCEKWNCEKVRVEEILSQFDEESFNLILKKSQKDVGFIYQSLFEIQKDIKKREKVEILELSNDLLLDLFELVSKKNLNLNMLREIFVDLYKNKIYEISSLENYLEEKGLLGLDISEEEIEERVKKVIENNSGAPFGALMGKAMAEFQGKVDGKIISQTLRKLM